MMVDDDGEERSSCLVGLLVLLVGAVIGWVVVGAVAWGLIQWWNS